MVEKSGTLPADLLLKKGLEELSIPVRTEQVNSFLTYLQELKRWNRVYSLTSIIKDEEIIIKHFIDSLLYLKAIPDGTRDIMDVGSGAGFPGLPIKIIRPEIRLYLVEPSMKKAGFLIHIIRTLRIEDVDVLERRVEDVSDIKVDIAVTRALFDIKDFYRKACHVLREGGRMVVSKGPKIERELEDIKGKVRLETIRIRLPLTNIYRNIVSIFPEPVKETWSYHDSSRPTMKTPNICFNLQCRLRKAGCRGFEGCLGFKTKS